VTVDVRKAVVVLRMQGAGDLLLEKWALMKKAPMFEEVYSVSLRAGD
jgi:hypothetical protein